MRILVVQESDWLDRGPHQSHHIMERLSEKGHEIRAIDFEIGWRMRKTQKIVSDRVCFENVHKATVRGRVTVVRPSIVRLPVLEYFSLMITHLREISHQVKEFDPDVIVGFGILNSWLAIRLARKHDIPFIYYVIDELHRLVPQRVLRKLAERIERSNMRHSTIIVSINECLRSHSTEMGAPTERTVVVKAGIDLEKYNLETGRDSVRKEFGIDNTDIVLFFMGWLYDFSGLQEVASELAKTALSYPRTRLMIVGRGPLWEELSRLRDSTAIGDRLTLIGWVPYETIPAYLAASDICILPACNHEIMRNIVPIKMYEYMAAGKPVIATKLSGILREFGQDNGVIFVDSSRDVISRANDMINDKTADEIGGKAREFVKHNDWATIVDQFEKILDDAA